MSKIFQSDYFKVNPNTNISPFQLLIAYLSGSLFQTVVDNPVTAYRQLLQQYAKDNNGKFIDPKLARQEVNNIFKKSPLSASLSGLIPRIIGIMLKRIPKFGFFLGISYFMNEGEHPGMISAVGASIFSAYFINPIRMIEKQQRTSLKDTGHQKPIIKILQESSAKNFKPLFRGTIPLMGHSLASATTGLVGQPALQKYIESKLNNRFIQNRTTSSLIASAIVSPIYIIMTNPLSRLEVIMQTASIKSRHITMYQALKDLYIDSHKFGLRGVFRGQGIGIVKAIISLTAFHEGRIHATNYIKNRNKKNL